MGGKREQDKKGSRRSWGWDGTPLIIEQRRRGAGKRTRGGDTHPSINAGRSNQPCLHVGKGAPSGQVAESPNGHRRPGPVINSFTVTDRLAGTGRPICLDTAYPTSLRGPYGSGGKGGVEAGERDTGGGSVGILAARSRITARVVGGARWRAVNAGDG